MLHLTAYHQSSTVADNRKAPAGKLQFENERVALSPRLPTALSSSISHQPDVVSAQYSRLYIFVWFYFFTFFSIFSSFLDPFCLCPKQPATVTLTEAITQLLLPHTAYEWLPQVNIFTSMIW